jgi:hypothetical protein
MLALWLATGFLASTEAAPAQDEAPIKGSYIAVERKPRKSWAEDRAELRDLIERAFSDPSNEADAVQEIAAPAVTISGPRIVIDWDDLSSDMAALRQAAAEYAAYLAFAAQEAAQKAADEADEDDALAMLLAA